MVTAKEIKELRNKLGIVFHEAKRILWKRDLVKKVDDARTIGDVKEILVEIISKKD